jgi:DNA-binding transcriptional ArsR family regulator
MSTMLVSEPLAIDLQKIRKASLHFRAINNNFRLQILQLIHQHQQLNVTDIYVKLRADQSKTSVHLSILRKANVVYAQREGKSIFYSINYEHLKHLHVMADGILNNVD